MIVITPAMSAYDTPDQEGGVGDGYKKAVRAIEDALRHASIPFLNADNVFGDVKKNSIFMGYGSDRLARPRESHCRKSFGSSQDAMRQKDDGDLLHASPSIVRTSHPANCCEPLRWPALGAADGEAPTAS